MSNTDLWDKLGKTDPKHTKQFTRAGGFKGTAIKPMWAYRRMTEEFGPVGTGWGVYEPTFQVVPAEAGEVMVYCTVSIWYEKAGQVSWGVGGDKVVSKFSSGLKTDDEAFKKAFTDAITNALKLIGVGADVHMGMFDDSKYVNEMRSEFAESEPPAPEQKPFTNEPNFRRAKKDSKDLYQRLQKDVKDAPSQGELVKLMKSDEMIADLASLPEDWEKIVRSDAEIAFRAFNTAKLPDNDTFPGDIAPEMQEAARNLRAG